MSCSPPGASHPRFEYIGRFISLIHDCFHLSSSMHSMISGFMKGALPGEERCLAITPRIPGPDSMSGAAPGSGTEAVAVCRPRNLRKPYTPDQLIALNGIRQADTFRASIRQVLFHRARSLPGRGLRFSSTLTGRLEQVVATCFVRFTPVFGAWGKVRAHGAGATGHAPSHHFPKA